MQKDYLILNHAERMPVLISIHSSEYPDLLMSGYSVVFQGSKKECNAIFQEEDSLYEC